VYALRVLPQALWCLSASRLGRSD